MDEFQFEALLEGKTPSLDDFAGFVSVAERLPDELLWKIISGFPELNPVLRQAASNILQAKVTRIQVDAALNSIASRIVHQ